MSTKRKTTVAAEPSPKPKRRQATGIAVAKKRIRDIAVVDPVDEDSAGVSDATPKKASGRKKRASKNSVDSEGEDSAGLSDATPKKTTKRKKDAVFVKELPRTPLLQTKNTPSRVNFSYVENEAKDEESVAALTPKTPAQSSKKVRAQTTTTPSTAYSSAVNTPTASAPSSNVKKSRNSVKPVTPSSAISLRAPQSVPRSSNKKQESAFSTALANTSFPKCHLPSTTSAVPSKAPYSDPTDELQDEREILAIWRQVFSALSVSIVYVVPSVVMVLAFACAKLGLTVGSAVASVAIIYSVLVATALLPYFVMIVPFIMFSRLLSDLATGADHLMSNHVKRNINYYCRLAALGIVLLTVYNSYGEKKACCAH